MGINTLEELKTLRDFLTLKGKTKYSVREVFRLADIIYPQVDGIMDDFRIRHRIANPDKYLEFNIKVPNYFCNVGEKAEEIIGYPIPEDVDCYIWECLNDELSSFMEENAPNREYFYAGRSGGWLVVEHYFNWSGKGWDNLSRKEKLEHLVYNDIALFSIIAWRGLIDELNEVIFWIEFAEKLEQRKKEIEREEYADFVIENLKECMEFNEVNNLNESVGGEVISV